MIIKVTTQVYLDPVKEYELFGEYANNPKFHQISECTGSVGFEHSDIICNGIDLMMERNSNDQRRCG